MPQSRFVRNDLHGSAAEHKRGANQHGISDFFGDPNPFLRVGHGASLRFRNVQLFQQLFKDSAILRTVDGFAVRPDHFYAARGKRLGKVDCGLSSQRCNNPLRLLQPDNVHNILHGQRLKVQLVRGRIIRGDRFRIVVDDNRLVSGLPDGLNGMYRGIIELHALPDADGTRAEHDDLFFLRMCGGLVFLRVSGIVVRNVSVKFRCAGVNRFIDGVKLFPLPEIGDLCFTAVPELRDRFVGKAVFFAFRQCFTVKRVLCKLLFQLRDMCDLGEEKRINPGHPGNFPDVSAAAKQLRNHENPVVRRVDDIVLQRFLRHGRRFCRKQMIRARFQRTHRLEQALLAGSSDAHDFSRRLHLRGKAVARTGKFIKRKARHFGHDIIKRRLKACRCIGKQNLVQPHSHRNLGRDAGNRKAACFACQCGRARNSGVDFNDIVAEGLRVQCKLNVASAFDLQTADDFQGAVAKHLVFAVGQGLAGANHDGVSRVYADRIQIFHIADGDCRVICVPQDLIFDFFVALDALFHQHLPHRGKLQRVLHNPAEIPAIVGKSAARAAECKCRAQNHRIADALRRGKSFLHGGGNFGGADRFSDALAKLLEQLSVLGALDAFALGPEQFHAAFPQHALLFQLHGKIQTGLPAKPRDDGVRTFITDDFRYVFQRQRLHVNLVCHGRIRHNRCGIGVAEHDLVPLFLQREARLCSGVIEFRALPDHDGAASDDHNLFQIVSLRHFPLLRSFSFPRQTGQTGIRCPPAPARSPDGTAPKRRGRAHSARPPPCRPAG